MHFLSAMLGDGALGRCMARGVFVASVGVLAACDTYDDLVPDGPDSGHDAGQRDASADSAGQDASGTAGEAGEAGQGGSAGSGDVEGGDPDVAASVDAGRDGAGGASVVEGGDVATGGGGTLDASDASTVDAGLSDGAVSVSDAAREAGPLVEELIDNMEDGNSAIPATKGRSGTWSVSHDDTVGAVQTPTNPFTMTTIAGGRGASTKAANTSGHGFTGWGAQLLVQLNQKAAAAKAPYDASAYSGITFWAKVGATHAATVQMRIPDINSDPLGGVCVTTACNDHHATAPLTWTTEWQRYTYYFDDLLQSGFGVPNGRLDSAHIYEIQFTVIGGQEFDFWIDDLAFVVK